MGCGLGATLRSIARQLPSADLHGITLVPWQLEQGRRTQTVRLRNPPQHHISVSATTNTPHSRQNLSMPSTPSRAVATAPASSKSRLIREAHRLLRPGGRFVVADGFISIWKTPRSPAIHLPQTLRLLGRSKTLADIRAFTRELHRVGFRQITVEQIQSPRHPFRVSRPLSHTQIRRVRPLRQKKNDLRARWNNVLAPILLPFVGYPPRPPRLLPRLRHSRLMSA